MCCHLDVLMKSCLCIRLSREAVRFGGEKFKVLGALNCFSGSAQFPHL